MLKKERHILISTCFGHFMCHFNMLVFPAIVIPLMGRLDLPMANVLELSFFMYLLFGLTALPWGITADRIGAKRLFYLMYVGAGASGLCAAFFMDSVIGLTISFACIGVFSGIYHPIGLGLISKEVSRVSMAMGYNGMFGNLGLAMGPLIAGIVNWAWGPSAVYIVVGLVNLTGLFLLAGFPLVVSAKKSISKSVGSDKTFSTFCILLVAMMLGGIVYRGAAVIMPAYFELNMMGFNKILTSSTGGNISGNLVATVITSMVFLVGVIAQLVGGKLAETYKPQYCYLVFHLITIPAAFLISAVSDLPLVFCAMIFFFFLLGMQPSENTLVARLSPKKLHHSAYGLKFILTFGVGAMSVKLTGAIESMYGLNTVFPVLGTVSMMIVFTVWVLIRNLKQKQKDEKKLAVDTAHSEGYL